MENINITSGVDFHIINAPKFKTNLLSIYFNIPLKRETVTYAALLPSVLKRGSKKLPTLRDISRKLDDLYSASLSVGIRTKGDGEVLYFTVEYIADEYIGENLTEEICSFLHDFMFEPLTEDNGFKADIVSSEKVNLKNAIEGIINDKKAYAEFKCREAMFNKTGFGMCEAGYIEDFDEITPEKLLSFYDDILKNAKADIFLSGNISDKMIDTINHMLFSDFSARSSSYIKSEIAEITDKELRVVIEDADVVQSKLCMGLRCGVDPLSDEYYSLMLASCIFGGSPFSKLFNNVREKLSLAYYILSRVSKFNSVMMISSGIQTENYQAAYDEIMLQFNKMCNAEINDFEIDSAKKYLKRSLTSIYDSMRGMEDFCLTQTILGNDETLQDVIERIEAVTLPQVCDVMKKIKFDTVYFLKGNSVKEA